MPDDRNKLLEAEAQARRVATRMLPADGLLNVRHKKECRADLDAHMKRHGLSQKDLAMGIGENTTYINNLLTNPSALPEGVEDRLWRSIDPWIDRDARARENRRDGVYVQTKVAERIIDLVKRLGEYTEIAIAFGPAGIGKSVAAAACEAEISNCYVVTCDHDTRYPSGILRKTLLTVSRRQPPQTVRLADVVERVRKPARIETRTVLVYDQSHVVADKTYRVLAELSDAAQCSILLLGTVDLKRRISSDNDPDFGQLSSRVGLRIDLAPELGGVNPGGKSTALFSVADVRAMFKKGRLKLHANAAKMLADIANQHRGTLRRVNRLYYWAETAARSDGSEEILAKHVKLAAAVVEEDMSIEEPIETAEVAEAIA
jgi:DNA transposition AAA+ family ATPase